MKRNAKPPHDHKTRLENLRLRQQQSNDLGRIDAQVKPLPKPTVATTKVKFTSKNVRPPAPAPKKPAPAWFILLKYLFRVTVVGLGFSLIVGTAIATLTNSYRPPVKVTTQPSTPPALLSSQVQIQAMPLKNKILAAAAKEPSLDLYLLIADLDNKNSVNIKSEQVVSSASLIKLPLLVAFLQEVDGGGVQLNEMLEMTEDVKAGQAGDLQKLPLGSKISALETLTKMIAISDNTATNMILKRLGGKEKVNPKFKSWGLTTTSINSPLPDLEGTNTTSARDLVNLFGGVEAGRWLKPRSRDRLLDIMRRTETNSLLPQGIEPNARIAHKTGNLSKVVGDVGLVDTTDGKRYIIAAIVKRPKEDRQAEELIRQISRLTYESLTSKPINSLNNQAQNP
jgi:beta-lactamase class A